jgi:DNA repair protein RadD
MTIILREYQQRAVDDLYAWWVGHPGIDEIPIMALPTASGKSIIIAELVRLLFAYWPEDHPRTVVLVPSKELAEQNAEKLRALLPPEISVGFYSASLGKKQHWADVIVATIGSVYKSASLLGSVKCVLIDECHLVNPDGDDVGRYRQFLKDLSQTCSFRVAGCTATPFRGNGVWLTDGDAPLFTGVSTTIKIGDLIAEGYLSPMVRPIDIATRIDTEGIKTVTGDFHLGQLSDRVKLYLPSAADESVKLCIDRKKWIAFLPSVTTAVYFVSLLRQRGIEAVLVCGSTPKDERAELIAAFRAGKLRCLVTVLALAIGFDVPDVDAVIWLRPTKSPVLYVQGAGRGMRIAPDAGKIDCLWVDFSDTTERLGPVDAIKGRKKRAAQPDQEAPYALCPECGTHVRPANALICPDCGAVLRDPTAEAEAEAKASAAAILSSQLAARIRVYPVQRVTYQAHKKPGSPDSLKVTYWGGMLPIASEWVCLNHEGYARKRAEDWWIKRRPVEGLTIVPSVDQSIGWINGGYTPRQPTSITVNESGKYPEITKYEWSQDATPDGQAPA